MTLRLLSALVLGAAVAFDLTIAETEPEGLVAALRDATAGRARIERTPSDRAR